LMHYLLFKNMFGLPIESPPYVLVRILSISMA